MIDLSPVWPETDGETGETNYCPGFFKYLVLEQIINVEHL